MRKLVILFVIALVGVWMLWPTVPTTFEVSSGNSPQHVLWTLPARPTLSGPVVSEDINLVEWAVIQTGTIILILLSLIVIQPSWLKLEKEHDQRISFKRIVGILVTLTIGGLIWFTISYYMTAPAKFTAENGKIQISAHNGDTLIVPTTASVGGESAGAMTLTGPVIVTATKTEPRIGWSTKMPYFFMQFQQIPEGKYRESGILQTNGEANVSIVEIRNTPEVYVQETHGRRLFIPVLFAIIQIMFSYFLTAGWLYYEEEPRENVKHTG